MPLLEAAACHLILVPTEVMSEFMQISGADLASEGSLVLVGEIPEVFEKKQDLRRQRVGTIGARMRVPDEKSEEVIVLAAREGRILRTILETDSHGTGGIAHLGRQRAVGGGDGLFGEGVQLGGLQCDNGPGLSAAVPSRGRTDRPFVRATTPPR